MLRTKLTGDAPVRLPGQGRDAGDLAQGPRPRPARTTDIEGLPGIFGEQTSKRVYPAGSVGANVVGFVGADGQGPRRARVRPGQTAGRHATARRPTSCGAGGRRIPSGVDTERDAVPGTDVALTIDRDIQWVAQKAIAKAVAADTARRAAPSS